MIRKIGLFFGAVCCLGVASAQSFTSTEIAPDAVSAGMANSTIAMDAVGFSAINNIAATSLSEYNWETAYGFTSWIGKDMLHSLAGYYKLSDRSSLGLGIRYLQRESIDATEDGITFTKVTPYDAIFDLGYSYAISEHFSLGAGARYLTAKLGQNDFQNAVALNAGVHYRNGAWSAAFTLDNLGMRLDNGTGGMPANANLGGAYRYDFAERHSFVGALQARYRFLADDMNHFSGSVGAQYTYDGMFAVRAGFHIGDETKSVGNYGSVGLSAYIDWATIDCSYMIADSPANNIWRISLGVRF